MAVPGKRAPKQFSSSTLSAGSDEDLHIYCRPCKLDGCRRPAYYICTDCKEHLCPNCSNLHARYKGHVTTRAGEPDNLTQQCLKHKKETLNFYCNIHNELLCSVCVSLVHTTCKVNYIPDISAEYVNGPEQKATLKIIAEIIDRYKMISEFAKTLTLKSNNSLKDVKADIKKFREEVNQRLDEMEQRFDQVAKMTEEGNNKKMQTVETAYDDAAKTLTTLSVTIQQLNKPTQADRLFIELKSSQQMIANCKRNICQLALNAFKQYNFVPNAKVSALLKEEKSFRVVAEVSLSGSSLKQLELALPTVKSRQVLKQGVVRVKTSNDTIQCSIYKMTLLTPDCLIITDQVNKALFMVDIGSQNVIDRLQVESPVGNLTSVSSTDLAVTLPKENKIEFISTLSGKLREQKTLKVDGECYGISYYQEKLVISYHDPVKLQIFNINGSVLTTVREEHVSSLPVNVACNSSSIYVLDIGKKRVTRLNWQGEMIGSFGDMKHPSGMTLSSDGTIFVCDYVRNVLMEISGDCYTGTVVLQNVRNPSDVCWCPETRTLFVNTKRSIAGPNLIETFSLL